MQIFLPCIIVYFVSGCVLSWISGIDCGLGLHLHSSLRWSCRHSILLDPSHQRLLHSHSRLLGWHHSVLQLCPHSVLHLSFYSRLLCPHSRLGSLLVSITPALFSMSRSRSTFCPLTTPLPTSYMAQSLVYRLPSLSFWRL